LCCPWEEFAMARNGWKVVPDGGTTCQNPSLRRSS
jgi:hypothetical protein